MLRIQLLATTRSWIRQTEEVVTHMDDTPSQPYFAADSRDAASRRIVPARYPNNLPLQLNRFIGREQAMDEIKRTLWSTRLLTLTGPGGCGKTRLAMQVAADLLDAFSDGVWLIELASLADAALIARTIMTVLDMHE